MALIAYAGGNEKEENQLAQILIVQQHTKSGPLLQKILEQSGHDVIVMHGGAEALADISPCSPSLVIADVVTDRSKRMETLHRLHQFAPNAKIIAILSESEKGATRFEDIADQPGVFRVIHDPFDVGGLLDAMQNVTE